jgi:hypothetical protein
VQKRNCTRSHSRVKNGKKATTHLMAVVPGPKGAKKTTSVEAVVPGVKGAKKNLQVYWLSFQD